MVNLDTCLNWLKAHAWALLKEQLNHLRYEERIRELEAAASDLLKERDRVQHKVGEEESRYGKRNDEVKKWISDVDALISEYKEFYDHHQYNCHDLAKFEFFTTGYLPKPGIRYCLSREASDITRKLNGALLQKTKLDMFYSHGPLSMAATFADTGYESLPTRDKIVEEIRAVLDLSGDRVIGVYGSSGVGKTTLVKQVAKRALEAKMFDVVIMTSVTIVPNIRRIQGEICDFLGMKLEEESESGRAARIRERLKNEKENTLIILDDLWEKLDFNMLGFPSTNDDDGNPPAVADSIAPTVKEKDDRFTCDKVQTGESCGRHKGCKILMISEAKQFLSKQVDGEISHLFPIECLEKQEAETLFKKIAGIGDGKNFELQKLATQIAGKCDGLPMSIVTTAKALKNKSISKWEESRSSLESGMFAGVPDASIKLSYELLQNEELKNAFLLCARMGRDILVMDFVKYCMGLGFLQGIHTVAEARDSVSALLQELKESGLLSDSSSCNCFTMQGIVQQTALSIASKQKQVFMMTKGKLDEWPDELELERYAAISLWHCHIEFPERIKCSRLKVFHLDSLEPHLEMPDNLFEGMMELRVLILIGIHRSPLPPSIRLLTKLRMLCLERCRIDDEQLSFIGELNNLRIFSLAGSDFKKLPDKLKQLSKLQILDISDCSKLVIPPNIISCLTSLEELYMRNSLVQWKIDEQDSQSEHASLSELRYLNKLTTVDIQIPGAAHLPKDLFFDKLDNYKIVIGDLSTYLKWDFKMPEKYEATRFLALQPKNDFDIHAMKGIKMLFERVENLLLGELHSVKHVFYELNVKGFPFLKHLSIVSNSDIQCIIKSTDEQHPEEAFTNLESMFLYKLMNMQFICYGKFRDASFSKLKIIKISFCNKLENVFISSMVGYLTKLETIDVSECDLLKGIVAVENSPEEMKFLELRSLKLQSLSGFVGFYSITEEPNREPRELFDEKVVVSELQRLELSSLNIQKIWSETPLSSSYFDKLSHMDVSDCGSLEYLLSLSMAKKLVNLRSLFLSKCDMMEKIFKQEEVDEDSIFPKLRSIKLSSMKRLGNIWLAKDPVNSYGKLDSLIIEDCDKLDHVFSVDKVGRFGSLCSLRVSRCKSMQVIFDLKDGGKCVSGPGDGINLQNIHLEELPKLKHIWKMEAVGTTPYPRDLQKIWVCECPRLRNMFPLSVAEGLGKLEYLVVSKCGWLEHIVVRDESHKDCIPFKFPKLATIQFSQLPKLVSFYPDVSQLICPALTDLSIELCDELEPFEKRSTDQPIMPGFFPKEIIYNLESMQLQQPEANWLKDYIRDYRMYNIKELNFSALVDYEILYFFLHRSPNVEGLWLNNCFLEELVPHLPNNEKLGVVPKLKKLKLTDLLLLRDIGFERDIIFQRIESLILKNCPHLSTMLPPSVSFTLLTDLEVVNCDGLTNLMAPSTAKSLIQLTTMKVVQCKHMKEIVARDGSEINIAIVFKQLKVLELVSLEYLSCFCSSQSCSFEFPSLDKLVVSLCPKIESFTMDRDESEPLKPPHLQKIYTAHHKVGPRFCIWEGDINATIQKIHNDKLYLNLEGIDKVEIGSNMTLLAWNNVEETLHGFDSLKTLTLRDCQYGKVAISVTILRNLRKLENLHIQNCNKFDTVFDQEVEEIEGATFLLKELTFDGLPKLMHIWNPGNNKSIKEHVPIREERNREGLASFRNLQKVVVAECRGLKYVFPTALAKNLKKLVELEVRDCKEMLEIVKKEAQGAEELLFPSLSSLTLSELPQLTYFHSGSLNQQELSHLDVSSCGKLELFHCEQKARPLDQTATSAYNELSSLDQMVLDFPVNLEALTLNWKDTEMLCKRPAPVELDKLNQLKLWFGDANEVRSFPFELFVKGLKAPTLELLQVSRCSGLKEIFPPRTDETGEESIPGHLNEMCLSELFELEGIGFQHQWVSRLCGKLHTLTVASCPRLTTLIVQVPPQASFSHLKQLTVQDCGKLKNLFTSSMANELKSLQEMHIQKCELMEKIVVADEQDEAANPEKIQLERLKMIVLDSLTSLQSFYSGSGTLLLPALAKVVLQHCPKMRTFSEAFQHAESYSSDRILVSLGSHDTLVLRNELNLIFLQQESLSLGDPLLQKIWLGIRSVPGRYFYNLKSLFLEDCKFSMEDCEFSKVAVLPLHLLTSLRNLEELRVRKCNHVEAVFAPLEPNSDPISIRLKKLILEELPNLKHVWNDDPKGSLHLPYLEEVLVDGCESLIALSLPEVKRLKRLDVSNCEELVEIVIKDEQATQKNDERAKRTPNLLHSLLRSLRHSQAQTSLRLWNLPNLKHIFPGPLIMEWLKKLKALDVSFCQMLAILAPELQTSSSFAEEVTRPLEKLSLNREDTMMIKQGELHLDLKQLKFLKFQLFDHESDVFPYWLSSKVSLPKVEKLGVANSAFKEIIPSQKPDIGDTKILSQLKGLELDHLSDLKSIGFEHSWMKPFPENLQTLVVLACSSLTKLVASAVSFSKLTDLIIENCEGLECLFTSSTATSLGLLNKMSVTNCMSMKTIVDREADEPDEGEIKFTSLKILSLAKLPKLGSFYAGTYKLNFPSMEDVSVTRCHNMKTFCNGDILVPKNLEGEIDGVRFYGDLNTVIKGLSQEGSSHS